MKGDPMWKVEYGTGPEIIGRVYVRCCCPSIATTVAAQQLHLLPKFFRAPEMINSNGIPRHSTVFDVVG